MNVLIFHAEDGEASDRLDARRRNVQWLEKMWYEHQRIYGNRYTDKFFTFETEEVPAGYVDSMATWAILSNLSLNPILPTERLLSCFLSEDEGDAALGGWLTEEGDLTLVCGNVEYRKGNRKRLKCAQSFLSWGPTSPMAQWRREYKTSGARSRLCYLSRRIPSHWERSNDKRRVINESDIGRLYAELNSILRSRRTISCSEVEKRCTGENKLIG